jgi:hypothetical protein
MSSNYVFSTLAIGPEYIYKVSTLIDSVISLTNADLIVITDNIQEIENYIKSNELNNNRIKIINYYDVSDKNIWFGERQFNFNLKILPTRVAYDMHQYDMIIHIDADAFLLGWNEDEIQQCISSDDVGMIARFRNRPVDEVGVHFILEPKARDLSIELVNIMAPLPVEVLMIFKPNCPEFEKFIEEWTVITERCYGRGINPFMEALEISYALSESKLPYHHLLTNLRLYPTLSNVRYLHHDKIMKLI